MRDTHLSTTSFIEFGVPTRSGAGDATLPFAAASCAFGAEGAVGGGAAVRRGSVGAWLAPLGTAALPLTGFSAGADGVPAFEGGTVEG